MDYFFKLHIQHLCKNYGELQVLKDVNMDLTSDKIYCLMGPSGSGKTTLFRILLELERADSGQFHFSAKDSITPSISAVFQENRLCERFSPLKNIMLACGTSVSKDTAYQELCRLLPEESIHRPCSTLSGGMKRRVAVARALLAASQVILMDEPFTGLDEDTKAVVIAYIKEKAPHKLLLISTHQEEDVDALGADLLLLSTMSD